MSVCFLFSYSVCKSTHKNETRKQIINKMRDKTTKMMFYPAKRNKKILFILF
ncbi:conserved domain protein [Bacteroides fluxus YIT 12057]|uniref:Conserved domain protein n=1 Tax=Bacteroides fluxus YIT 12057 TaxID=763034 RepID=F3PRB6_9BACE|nr:conserved domain protein [Bacteroides fluxus YIT 12057]